MTPTAAMTMGQERAVSSAAIAAPVSGAPLGMNDHQAGNNHDGAVYALPMLSIGGDSFSAVPQSPRTGTPSMRSYALNPQALASAHSCALQQNLGVAPSKAVFGFASANALPNLVYSDNAQVVLHDGALDRSFVLPPVKHQQLASAFPGITRDGRIVFAATWRDCETGTCPQQAGYLVLDPYQNPAYQAARQAANLPLKSCITRSEVATERKRFADFHGIPAMGQFAP